MEGRKSRTTSPPRSGAGAGTAPDRDGRGSSTASPSRPAKRKRRSSHTQSAARSTKQRASVEPAAGAHAHRALVFDPVPLPASLPSLPAPSWVFPSASALLLPPSFFHTGAMCVPPSPATPFPSSPLLPPPAVDKLVAATEALDAFLPPGSQPYVAR